MTLCTANRRLDSMSWQSQVFRACNMCQLALSSALLCTCSGATPFDFVTNLLLHINCWALKSPITPPPSLSLSNHFNCLEWNWYGDCDGSINSRPPYIATPTIWRSTNYVEELLDMWLRNLFKMLSRVQAVKFIICPASGQRNWINFSKQSSLCTFCLVGTAAGLKI